MRFSMRCSTTKALVLTVAIGWLSISVASNRLAPHAISAATQWLTKAASLGGPLHLSPSKGALTSLIAISETGRPDAQSVLSAVPTVSCAANEIKVDDGTFETAIAVSGGDTYAVNRLAPASYPATLNGISIFWPSGAALQAGTNITLLVGANPAGTSGINGLFFQTMPATVQTLGQFNVYSVPTVTINSGDFVVGFRMTHPSDVFPVVDDKTPPLQRRSYLSANGNTFFIVDDLQASLAGNFGIRAQLQGGSTLCCPSVTGINPTSGGVGASVTITGANFTGVNAVKFANNLIATFTVNSDTQITATVPAGAVTGPITISKTGCPDAQTASFSVGASSGTQNGFLYVLSDRTNGNQIFGFAASETTGALTTLTGFPMSTGGNGAGCCSGEGLAIDQANQRLYAINNGSDTVSAYTINPTTGALTALPFSPISLGSGEWLTITVHPGGSPLVVGDYDGNGRQASYRVTSTTATAASGSPYSAGGARPFKTVFSQDGSYLYMGGGGTTFAGFSVSTATGILSALAGSPFETDGLTAPDAFATDTAGRVFLAGSQGPLRVYTTANGIPSAVPGNPFTSGLRSPSAGLVYPNGFYMVSDSFLPSLVGVYRINGSGSATTLAAIGGSPFAVGPLFPRFLALNRSGTFLFCANSPSRSFTMFSVNSTTGALTGLGSQPDNTLGTTGTLSGLVYFSGSCPAVSNINPTSGAVGGNVTITGTNLTGVTAVKFANNVSANFTVNGATQITATVPAGAVTGSITISKPGCSDAQTGSFSVSSTTNRVLRVVASSGSAGGMVSVPIELLSQGDENALGFSLTFDPTVLSSPQASLGSGAAGAALTVNSTQAGQGRFGLQLGLPTNQRFTAGTRQVAVVSFVIAGATSAPSTTVGFGDQPIFREISDPAAMSLPVTYQSGQITIVQGFEADVVPRPSGNGAVTTTDWVQNGRFTAALDMPATGSEFQRADCAPIASLGDGRLTATDWVQAARYAAGLDPLTSAGGPTTPAPFTASSSVVAFTSAARREAQGRTVRVVNANIPRGQQGTVTVELDAQGNENALGFSLSFDPTQLQYLSAAPGSDAGNATINLNPTQADAGRLGLLIGLQPAQTFAAGRRQIVVITFTATTAGTGSTTTLSFADQPVFREVSDASANVLTATFASGSITLTRSVATVSAATFAGGTLADEAIVAAFGSNLATRTEVAMTVPLPEDLAGTTITVRDAIGVERRAPLFFVSGGQVNFQIPPGTLNGAGTITVRSGDGAVSVGTIQITRTAPGIFAAHANGQGIAAAQILRIKGDGAQSFEPVAQFDQGQAKFLPIPIDLGPVSDQVFLVLYGTGIRNRSALSAVTATVGGAAANPLYAGSQGGFVGLDQVNLPLSRSLIGRGEVIVTLTVDGRMANPVTVTMK